MFDAVSKSFNRLAGEMETISLPSVRDMGMGGSWQESELGKLLRIRKREHAPIQILLCGHMDTVFGADHSFQTTQQVDSNVLNGPGVADMKGGLVVMLYALLALESHHVADNIGWEVLISPDEEIGSPGSSAVIEQSALNHHLAFVFEPALDLDGSIVNQRKGSVNQSIVVRGVAAHDGRAFHDGRNAIIAMTKVLNDIFELNGQRENVTVNVAIISGGSAVNIVPDVCVSKIGVRTSHLDDHHWVNEEMTRIIDSYQDLEDIKIELYLKSTRVPKPLTPAIENLLTAIADVGNELGINVSFKPSGGCCDGNNIAALGVPVVDSLGVVGTHLHSDKEFILIDSLVERAQLTTLFLLKLAAGEISL